MDLHGNQKPLPDEAEKDKLLTKAQRRNFPEFKAGNYGI